MSWNMNNACFGEFVNFNQSECIYKTGRGSIPNRGPIFSHRNEWAYILANLFPLHDSQKRAAGMCKFHVQSNFIFVKLGLYLLLCKFSTQSEIMAVCDIESLSHLTSLLGRKGFMMMLLRKCWQQFQPYSGMVNRRKLIVFYLKGIAMDSLAIWESIICERKLIYTWFWAQICAHLGQFWSGVNKKICIEMFIPT